MSPGALIERYLGAARSGDWDAAYGHYADDIVFRIPGRSRFAGEQRGRDAAIAYIETARALSRHDVTLEVVDRLESAERVALLVRERFDIGGREVEIRRANVYRVAGDRIAEIWIFEGNQYEVDALLA